MTNFYYDSYEDTGLLTIGEISLYPPDYSFDLLKIWVDPNTGIFYGATSSGCSCPCPFEEYSKVSDLDNLGTNPHKVVSYIRSFDSQDEDPESLISAVMSYRKGA